MRHSYIPQIDSLRAFAVLAVLVFHLNDDWLPGGFAGVDVFFVISGYVVSASLIRSTATRFGPFALGFYAKRILRIVPALLVCLTATALLTVAFIPNSWLSQSNYTTLLLALVGLSNFSLMNTGDSYFSPRIDFNPATHTWSLGVEEQFYLIFPALYFLWLRSQRGAGASRIGSWALPIAVAASFAYSAYASIHQPVFAYYSLPSRFWELGLGALLFQLHHRGRFIASTEGRFGLCMLAATGLLVVAMLYSSETSFPVPWGLAATLGSLLFIDAVVARTTEPSLTMQMIAAKPIVGIGKISYSLYLWHWPVYVLFRWTTGLETPLQMASAVAIVFVLATASYRFLEVPIRHNPSILRRPSGYVVAGGIATVALSVAVTFAAMNARSYITLSVTRNAHDWYSTPWPIEEAGPSDGCRTVARWRKFANGGVHDFVREGCATDAQRQLFVVGDSHAGALMTMLSKYALAERTNVHLYNRSACSFLSIRSRMRQHDCLEFAAAFTAELRAKAKPGDVVLLPSLRVDRIADQWGGVPTRTVLRDALSPAARQALGMQEAEDWLRGIAALDVDVIFMAPTPVFAAPAFRCSDWFNRDNPICRPGLAMERKVLENLRRPALEGMLDIAQRHPSVIVWDPIDILCGKTTCNATREGRPIFFDGDHLSSFGNLLIYESFRSAVDSADHQPRSIAMLPGPGSAL